MRSVNPPCPPIPASSNSPANASAFCVTVAHARNLQRSLRALGVRAGMVHGEMPGELRARALRDFAEGKVQALTNVAVLTEGFDDPGFGVEFAEPLIRVNRSVA